MRFITIKKRRSVASIGATLALGLLAACGSSSFTDSGQSGASAVAGTFIDAPVQGLRYASTAWTAVGPKPLRWKAITSSADGTKLAAAAERGKIYTSTDSGATWTEQGAPTASWNSITSSEDGTKLAAVGSNAQIYTSADSGVTWAAHENSRNWISIATSSDGTKLAAASTGGITSGEIHTSANSGATWTNVTNLETPWRSIALSSDGTKLAAAAAGYGNDERIYTSTNSGVTQIGRGSTRQWRSIASSADGTKLAAVVAGGYIYTSGDSGLTWTGHESQRDWKSISSSSDGTKLAAVASNGQIYTSSDSGVTWTAQESKRDWRAITSSADGTKLAAVEYQGQIYINSSSGYKLTTADGKYDCSTGQDVTFYLGNQALGAVKCGEAVHVYHMAGSGDSVEKGVRVARLLQSLNTSTDTSKIVLPDLTGVTVNVRLDTNDADFEADVAALMAQLKTNGKVLVNTTPVTRADAVAHVETELGKLSDTQKTNLCTTNACNSVLLEKLVKPTAVKVSVTGLKTGQSIELKMTVNGSSSSLQLTGTTDTTLSAGFTTIPTSGQSYAVSGTASSSEFSCTYTNASGTYDPLNSPTVAITCSQNTRVNTTLSGTVTGLTAGQSVTLKNGVDSTATMQISSNGSFQWSPAITAGSSYNLVVSAQSPKNLVCTLSDGSGTAPTNVYSPNASAVSNIAVDCKLSGYSVSGTVTGLTSSDTVGLILYRGASNENGTPVSVKGASGGAAYTFTNATVNSGSPFRVAIDGNAPTGYTCAPVKYTTVSAMTGDVTDADVACTATSSGGGSVSPSPTVSAVSAVGTITAGSPAMFNITGTNLPTTAILVLGSGECTSSNATSTGLAATCTAPSTAGSLQAQVKSNTAANSGTAIGTSYTITVATSGGGAPPGPTPPEVPQNNNNLGGGGGGSCGTINNAGGKVGGSVSGLTSTISTVELRMHDDTNNLDIETLVVSYAPGCTSQYFTFQSALTGTSWTARSTTLKCTILNATAKTTPVSPAYVNDVSVTCSP
jgi:photosystem II stability/assembly factor-like uncharacterized protein